MAETEITTMTWTPKNSGSLYNLQGWGYPYFTTYDEHGSLLVRPHGDKTRKGQEIDLLEAVKKVMEQSCDDGRRIQFPLIVRFPDILADRLRSLQTAFDSNIKSLGYNKPYQGVFPVKVNQHRTVVEDIVRIGKDFNYGLEAGSKPELILAMSCLIKGGSKNAFLVCNGYKDKDYISLALFARSIGLNTYIVLEQERELDIILAAMQELKELDVWPVIGIRAKLLTKNPGHFGSTAGKHGKFGLTEDQIYAVAERLKQLDMLDCLQLLHFHIGSQIPSTDIVCRAVREAGGIYCKLVVNYHANLKVLDIGGGLGIDYNGTRSGSSDMSVAYSIEQYASAVVNAAKQECDENNVAHPILCSEGGRAMVSHHSILVLEALSAEEEAGDDVNEIMSKMEDLVASPGVHYNNVKNAISGSGGNSESLQHVNELKKHCVEIGKLCDKATKNLCADGDKIWFYHMNLSVFSLIPDFWGIKQLFPIMPIHRLNERPELNAMLIDLTCDSDGKMDQFIDGRKTLPVHKLEGQSGYFLGTFLTGAYQEAIGGKHNLFGGPSLARVESTKDSGFTVTMRALGTSSAEQLQAMRYDPCMVLDAIKKRAEEHHHWLPKERELVNKVLTTMPYLLN